MLRYSTTTVRLRRDPVLGYYSSSCSLVFSGLFVVVLYSFSKICLLSTICPFRSEVKMDECQYEHNWNVVGWQMGDADRRTVNRPSPIRRLLLFPRPITQHLNWQAHTRVDGPTCPIELGCTMLVVDSGPFSVVYAIRWSEQVPMCVRRDVARLGGCMSGVFFF